MNITKNNFPKLFLENFVPNMSYKELKKLHVLPFNDNGYLWMVCEHDLVKHLSGTEAKQKFDEVDKSGAFEIQFDNGFFGDEIACLLDKNHISSKLIDESQLVEFYVIGKDFSWCYIVTHEKDWCGPYFISK